MTFDVVFLGTGAAVPVPTRGTTSQFVDIHGHTYLIVSTVQYLRHRLVHLSLLLRRLGSPEAPTSHHHRTTLPGHL